MGLVKCQGFLQQPFGKATPKPTTSKTRFTYLKGAGAPWLLSIIPALGKLRQTDRREFEATLVYIEKRVPGQLQKVHVIISRGPVVQADG